MVPNQFGVLDCLENLLTNSLDPLLEHRFRRSLDPAPKVCLCTHPAVPPKLYRPQRLVPSVFVQGAVTLSFLPSSLLPLSLLSSSLPLMAEGSHFLSAAGTGWPFAWESEACDVGGSDG